MGTPIEDFHKRHGGDFVTHDGWLLWPDGAFRENTAYGVLCDGYSDPQQAARQIHLYWQVRLQIAVRQFDTLKTALTWQARAAANDGAPPPSEESLSELQRLREAVEVAKAGLAKAAESIEAAIPTAQKERAAARLERQEAGRQCVEKLNQITV